MWRLRTQTWTADRGQEYRVSRLQTRTAGPTLFLLHSVILFPGLEILVLSSSSDLQFMMKKALGSRDDNCGSQLQVMEKFL